jgi:hypothetical protein
VWAQAERARRSRRSPRSRAAIMTDMPTALESDFLMPTAAFLLLLLAVLVVGGLVIGGVLWVLVKGRDAP